MGSKRKQAEKFYANDFVGNVNVKGGRITVYRPASGVRIEFIASTGSHRFLLDAPVAEKVAKLVTQAATTTPLADRPAKRAAVEAGDTA